MCVQGLLRACRQRHADLVQPVSGDGAARVRVGNFRIQRRSAIGTIQPAGRQRLLRPRHQVGSRRPRRARRLDTAIELVQVAAATQQLAGLRGLERGLLHLASTQGRIGVRHQVAANLLQALVRRIVVRLHGQHGLEQLACAAAVAADQVALLQRLLGAAKHVVERGARHHAAQAALVDPGHGNHRREQQEHDDHPHAPTPAPWRRSRSQALASRGGKPGCRLGLCCVQAGQVAQGRFCPPRRALFVGISTSRHGGSLHGIE